ncbi:MAG: outer membrane beta-barrel protein [bacterium]
MEKRPYPKVKEFIKYIYIVCLLLLILLTIKDANAFLSPNRKYSNRDEWTGNLNFFIGQKSLDKDDWAPVEKQSEFGLELDFKRYHWPLSIAVELLYSIDKGSFLVDPNTGSMYVEGKTYELNFGVRKRFPLYKGITPFIGGGITNIWAKSKGDLRDIIVSSSDSNLGYWVSGGIYWTLQDMLNIGVEIRYSYAESDIFKNSDGSMSNAGGLHLGGLIGYHW